MRQMQPAFAVVFDLGGVEIVVMVGQAVALAVVVEVFGAPVQQRGHFEQAVWIAADGLHLRAVGGVAGEQGKGV